MQFKAVSSGQAVADAAVFTQVLQGNSLKPLAPSNLRGQRNSAGDLLIQWTRRTRLPSFLGPSEVPIAEERAQFEVDILSGSTVLRTFRGIYVGQEQPAVLISNLSNNPYDGVTGNTLTGTGTTPRFSGINAISLQTIDETENYIAANLTGAAGAEGDTFVGLIGASDPWLNAGVSSGDNPFKYGIYHNGNSGDSTIYENNASVATFTSSGNGARFWIKLQGDQVSYYIGSMGPGEQPTYVSTNVPIFPMRILAHVARSTGCIVSNVITTTAPTPGIIYTAAMQSAATDFGAPQSSIKVRVYQISARIGRGQYAEANL